MRKNEYKSKNEINIRIKENKDGKKKKRNPEVLTTRDNFDIDH